MAESGAMSEAVRPVRPDGGCDAEVVARLAVRHDDSLENVANRLALWDRQVRDNKLCKQSLWSCNFTITDRWVAAEQHPTALAAVLTLCAASAAKASFPWCKNWVYQFHWASYHDQFNAC